MAAKNQCYMDLNFTTNKHIEGNALVADWFADGSKSEATASAPVAPTETFKPTESLHQGFDLLV